MQYYIRTIRHTLREVRSNNGKTSPSIHALGSNRLQSLPLYRSVGLRSNKTLPKIIRVFTPSNSKVWMHASQRMRYSLLLCNIKDRLQDMALDPRGFPGIATEVRQLKSSASTPSLRSRESEFVPVARAMPDNGGGNVRVVVRVRGFLPRGTLMQWAFVDSV